MRRSIIIVLGASMAFALAAPVMAQTRGGQAPRVNPPTATPRGDQLHMQDRLYDKDKLHDQDRLKDQDKLQDRDRLHDQDGQAIYAYDLMTPAERNAYMTKLRSMKTVQERNAYRKQHRTEMLQRARERGVTIPSGNGQGAQQQGSENGN